MHDATKVQLGCTANTHKSVVNKLGTQEAGLALRLKSDDTLSVTSSDGDFLGVSIGKDMSDIGRTAIVRKGQMVPIQLTAGLTPTIGAVVSISDTTGKAAAAGAGATATAAVYRSSTLTGIKEDFTTEVNVAYIDFTGGL